MEREPDPPLVLRWPLVGADPWTLARETLSPAPGEVVLVSCALDWPAATRARFRTLLSPREEERARKFAWDELRERWLAGRALLRLLLGTALGEDPAGLRFTYGEHGKPSVAAEPPLAFNVSHSHGAGLYALARCEVGVDIEFVRARRTDDVAARFFHTNESAALQQLPEEQRREAFFGVWCGKEAFIKATGAGLSQSLSSFEFALGPRGPERVLWHRDDPQAASRWSVHLVDPAEGFRAALITERPGLGLRCFSLAPAPE